MKTEAIILVKDAGDGVVAVGVAIGAQVDASHPDRPAVFTPDNYAPVNGKGRAMDEGMVPGWLPGVRFIACRPEDELTPQSWRTSTGLRLVSIFGKNDERAEVEWFIDGKQVGAPSAIPVKVLHAFTMIDGPLFWEGDVLYRGQMEVGAIGQARSTWYWYLGEGAPDDISGDGCGSASEAKDQLLDALARIDGEDALIMGG